MIGEKIFLELWGSNPWPDFEDVHISFFGNGKKETLELIKKLKTLSEKWLFSKDSSFVFDTKLQNELINFVKNEVPNIEEYMKEKVIQ